jgi:hypothetical protein
MKLELSIAADGALTVRAAAPDQRAGASAVQSRDRLHADAGNGQLRTDQGQGRAVQDQVLGVLAHRPRDILQGSGR